MVKKRIEEALQVAENALQTALIQFDSGSNSLQLKASDSINLFGGTVTRQVSDLVTESRKLCDNLYAVCQTQVIILDETCRPLLSENPPVMALRDIWKMICRLNSESEIKNNFTASLNSSVLGDVATVQYHPSMECNMIQNYWETKYKNHSDREVFEQKEKAEEQRKNQEKKIASDKRKTSDKAEYEQAMQNWEKALKEIQPKREKALEEALNKEKTRIEKQLADAFEKENKKLSQAQEKEKKELEDAETALSNLRFYQFIKKTQYQKSVKAITERLNITQLAMAGAEQKYKNGLKNIDQTLKRQKSQLQKAINIELPLPRKPRKSVFMLFPNPTPLDQVNEALKEEIINALVKYGTLSYTELIEKCPALTDLTIRRVESYAKALEREGEIKITEKRINYNIHYFCELAY